MCIRDSVKSDAKVIPKSHSYTKLIPKWRQGDPQFTPYFYKIIQICVEMSVFWKCTFIYPKWLHNDPTVIPKWPKVTIIYPKWPQSGTKVIPKWPQSAPKVTLKCQSNPKVAPKSPSYAESHPKVIPKWPSRVKSDAKVIPKSHSYTKLVPKWRQSDPQFTPYFSKIIKICWGNEYFLKMYLHIPKVTPQSVSYTHLTLPTILRV